MARKYIKNCTGDECEIERKPTHFSLIVSKSIFLVLLVSFIFVSGYVLFFSPYLQISNIKISGTKELDVAQLEQKMQSIMQEKYFGIISKNNFMLVSQDEMVKSFVEDFKKIRKVTVTKKFPDSIMINIDERKALLVWCLDEKCYLVDENGTAYGEADFNSPELIQNNLLKIHDTSNRGVILGENILQQSYEKYALEIKDTLSNVGFEIDDNFLTPSRMAGEIRVKTEKGFDLYLSTNFPLESAIDTLLIIFKKEIPTEKIGELEYIDLRNENKVFYKFKNVNSENVEGDTGMNR